jgi:hypothetical protein
MTEHLLAAEADKIQDLIFRSSRLREVVGGSQLLSRFCQEVPAKILPPGARILVNEGGSFRVIFSDKDKAIVFGEELAEIYRRTTGSTLTVAAPVERDGDPKVASDRARNAILKAKQGQTGFIATSHWPYVAFCASCGVGLSVEYRVPPGKTRGQFLCRDCLTKQRERKRPCGKDPWNGKDPGEFLSSFFDAVVGNTWRKYRWPGKGIQNDQDADPATDVARFDSRGYVAYIIADGNNMGQIFDQCNDKQVVDLSKNLRPVLYASLAQPANDLVARAKDDKQDSFIPVLPLIAGGDDLFILLPAPWALDFARCFAVAYEKKMKEVVNDIANVDPPSIAVAVVICKAKYPYYLAHQHGEQFLKQAKQISKQRAICEKEKSAGTAFPHSIVSFGVIRGNRLAETEPSGPYRPTLLPFWVADSLPGWGICLQHLIEQRFALRDLPGKRLAQLRACFDELTNIQRLEECNAWSRRLGHIQRRIALNEDHEKALDRALKVLECEELYTVRRTTDRNAWKGHALPDLLNAWDFAFCLKRSRTEYEG